MEKRTNKMGIDNQKTSFEHQSLEVSMLDKDNFSDEELDSYLSKGEIKATDKVTIPPKILFVGDCTIATFGNFSASTGKAKSKKTFNVSAIVAAALKNGTVLSYTAELPENRRKILYVDTEQSSYHCAKVAKRILRMAGLPTGRNHKDLEFLVLRKYTPEERIAIVREAIYRTENVGLVVIDGIRDMVYDINSPSESTKVISLLMTWTGERHIHIHTILHQNKGDENARGHIGTELSNKAETVLQVEKDEKDPDISTVKAAHCPNCRTNTCSNTRIREKGKGRSSTPTRTSQRSSTASHWKRHSHSKMNTATRSLRKN